MPTADDFKKLVEACYNKETADITSPKNLTKGIYFLSATQDVCPEYKGIEGVLFVDGDLHQLFFPSLCFGYGNLIVSINEEE